MFERRAIEMKVVKTPKNETEPKEPRTRMSGEQIYKIAVDTVERAAFLAAVGYGLKKVLDTTSEIAIITAKTKIK